MIPALGSWAGGQPVTPNKISFPPFLILILSIPMSHPEISAPTSNKSSCLFACSFLLSLATDSLVKCGDTYHINRLLVGLTYDLWDVGEFGIIQVMLGMEGNDNV
ncbi:hypothetical protein CC2G_011396 [Coprinopsis cinerea AmutBmut pab1-1]|nr:hypothetical protein CC2G_011396 [Coprinopsis cinerea AmutBmut pab1-1]